MTSRICQLFPDAPGCANEIDTPVVPVVTAGLVGDPVAQPPVNPKLTAADEPTLTATRIRASTTTMSSIETTLSSSSSMVRVVTRSTSSISTTSVVTPSLISVVPLSSTSSTSSSTSSSASAAAASESASSNSASSSGLSTGAIVGVSAVGIAGCIFLAWLLMFCLKKKRQEREHEQALQTAFDPYINTGPQNSDENLLSAEQQRQSYGAVRDDHLRYSQMPQPMMQQYSARSSSPIAAFAGPPVVAAFGPPLPPVQAMNGSYPVADRYSAASVAYTRPEYSGAIMPMAGSDVSETLRNAGPTGRHAIPSPPSSSSGHGHSMSINSSTSSGLVHQRQSHSTITSTQQRMRESKPLPNPYEQVSTQPKTGHVLKKRSLDDAYAMLD